MTTDTELQLALALRRNWVAHYGQEPSESQFQMICGFVDENPGLEPEWVDQAFRIGVQRGNVMWPYVRGILYRASMQGHMEGLGGDDPWERFSRRLQNSYDPEGDRIAASAPAKSRDVAATMWAQILSELAPQAPRVAVECTLKPLTGETVVDGVLFLRAENALQAYYASRYMGAAAEIGQALYGLVKIRTVFAEGYGDD